MSWHSRLFFLSFHEMCALSLRQRHYFCSAARSRKREASPRLFQSKERIEHISSRPPEALTLSKYKNPTQPVCLLAASLFRAALPNASEPQEDLPRTRMGAIPSWDRAQV